MNIDYHDHEADGKCCPVCKNSTFKTPEGDRVCDYPECDWKHVGKYAGSSGRDAI